MKSILMTLVMVLILAGLTLLIKHFKKCSMAKSFIFLLFFIYAASVGFTSLCILAIVAIIYVAIECVIIRKMSISYLLMDWYNDIFR